MPFEYLHLFDYSEKRDLYEAGGINSGAPTIFDHLRKEGIPYHLSNWRAGEESNLASLRSALSEGRIRFAYLYMAAMDAILHDDGKVSPRVDAKIAWYEAQLKEILRVARQKYSDVRLYVFSDHGMTDTRDTCDLMARINALGLRFGEDYVAVYDSTMARFWFLKQGAKDRIVSALQQEKRGRILSDADLEAYRCRFPANKYGELFFLLYPGVLLCPSFMGEKALKGMHGFDPKDKDTDSVFLASHAPSRVPQRLDDLYGLMLEESQRVKGS